MNTVSISEKTKAFVKALGIPESEIQRNAYERLLGIDFPTTRDEYWKYTRLGKLAKLELKNETHSFERINLNEYIIANDYLVVENGIVREDISQFSKLNFEIEILNADQLGSNPLFNSRLNQGDLFTNLNTAYFERAVSIRIEDKKINEGPLQIIYVNHGSNNISNNRILIEAGKFSENEIIQTYVSKGGSDNFTNQVTEVFLRENAKLTINKIQTENNATFHIATDQINQEDHSNFSINTITLGGIIVRNNVNITVSGENCETHMNGAIVTKENQHVDNHTFVDHLVANCFSNENYKYVLGDKSTGVFNGRVVVEKDAQVINAYQNNANILLSDDASINSKPELEIYADDVKCSHGSTTGQLDKNALFYLQSRGISKERSTQILVHAFIGEVLEAIENENVIELVHKRLNAVHNWDIL